MSRVENFVSILHADPETFTGVPTNVEIIAEIDKNNRPFKFEGDLSAVERGGFLEMWSFTHAKEVMAGMEQVELHSLHQEARAELANSELLASKFDDLRFIVSNVGQEIAARQYQTEEQAK